METLRNFFSNAYVKFSLAVAAIGAAIAGILIYRNNDFSPPPPQPEGRRDFTNDLNKLDPSKPIGVVINTIRPPGQGIFNTINDAPPLRNAQRNNLIETMRQHYGDNIIVIDNPSMQDLGDFSQQFNARFSADNPQVHFVAEHHQGTFNDRYFAQFLRSVNGRNKRALIRACGPDSSQYHLPDFDYVIIPRPDGQILGPAPDFLLDFRLSEGYRHAIGWMHDNSDPDEIRRRFNDPSLANMLQGISDRAVNIGFDVWHLQSPRSYLPPVVVTPTNLPPRIRAGAER